MRKKSASESGIFNPRIFLALILCSIGGFLAMLSLGRSGHCAVSVRGPSGAPPLTFGHPIISGIGGTGFEQDLRADLSMEPCLHQRAGGRRPPTPVGFGVPSILGKTFKWVIGATALEGKVTTCNGGRGYRARRGLGRHLYFNDLTLANFSTARSGRSGRDVYVQQHRRARDTSG